jgi:hypothetical protein
MILIAPGRNRQFSSPVVTGEVARRLCGETVGAVCCTDSAHAP